MTPNIKKLNIVTYLVPDLPVEMFETFSAYLENSLNIRCNLIYESRWRSPPRDRDLFALGEADMGFVNSSGFLRMLKEHKSVDLCPVGVVHDNPLVRGRPMYYSDVIMRSDSGHDYKEFHDLKGHKFAYSDPDSMSGAYIVLSELKNQKTNSSFFADTFQSGSHLDSIQMVLKKQVDAAAIDSRVLKYFLVRYPHYKKELQVITSLGPMPTNPIVFSKQLPDEIRSEITKALLAMPKDPVWSNTLEKLHIGDLVSIGTDLFDMEKVLVDSIKNLSMKPTYY